MSMFSLSEDQFTYEERGPDCFTHTHFTQFHEEQCNLPAVLRGNWRDCDRAVVVIPEESELEVRVDGILCDTDGTKLEGTVEHVHDGPRGRHSRALQMLLVGKVAERYEQDMSLVARALGGTLDGWEENWNGVFRKCTGRGEVDVCKALALCANEHFGHFGVAFDWTEICHATAVIGADQFDELFERIELVPGVRALLSDARDQRIKVVAWTSSPSHMMEQAYEKYELACFEQGTPRVSKSGGLYKSAQEPTDQLLHGYFCGAAKRDSSDPSGRTFSGETVREAARHLLDLPTEKIAVFGDTVSDAIAGLLGGAAFVVIRPEGTGEAQHKALENLREQIRDAFSSHAGELIGAGPIFIVLNWEQIRFTSTYKSANPTARVIERYRFFDYGSGI